MSLKFKAIAGALTSALVLAGCSDPFEGQTCAISPDGALVATADEGKTYRHLNGYMENQNPELAGWVEGKSGWGGKAICATTDGEHTMLMKDFVHGGKVAPHSEEEVEQYNHMRNVLRDNAPLPPR